MTNKIILTDADGVLLDWEWAFRVWMTERGYKFREVGKKNYYLHHHYEEMTSDEIKKLVKFFNESAAIGFLPALRDSMYYVKRLHEEHNYRFRVITSLSVDENAGKLRRMNLNKLFGDAIEDVIFLDTNEDKTRALLPYKDSKLWWIEDKFPNFQTGINLGLSSILMIHGFNMHEDTRGGYVAKDWKEIYNIVTSSN